MKLENLPQMGWPKFIVQALLLGGLLASPGWTEVSDDLARLCSPDVPSMVAAGESLCALEERAIPGLVQLLDRDETITPTSQLGADGSVMYAGHGGPGACFLYVFYGLNETEVRAGWMLERITFQDFGFGSEWDGDRRTVAERHAAATNAREWWASRKQGWTSLCGLEEALAGENGRAQGKALYFLRNQSRDRSCSGLNEQTYFSRVHPLIEKLVTSKYPETREAAAGIWARAEANRTGRRRHLFLKKPDPVTSEEQVYQLQGDSLTLDARVVARVGDPVSLLKSKIPCTDLLGMPLLETIPPLLVLEKNGRIDSWEDESEKALPWGPCRSNWLH